MENKYQKISLSLTVIVVGAAVLTYFFGVSLANFLEMARASLSFPYTIDYGEGPLLDQVLRMAAGESIYRSDLATPPYTISNYPPVFMLLQVPFFQIFGPAFWYGRLISVLSALMAALFLGLTLHTLSRDWLASAAGGLLLLAYPYVQFWSVLNRIDLLALAFSWAAIFTVVRWNERRWGIALAAALFVASIFTRQSYALAGPMGAFFWLLFMRGLRPALRLAAVVGGASLVLFLLINILTQNGFYLNIVAANVNPFSRERVIIFLKEFFSNSVVLLILTGLFLLLERAGKHTRSWPLALAYFAGAALGVLTIGKEGSNVNYMLELSAGLCFAAGASMAWFGRAVFIRLALLALLAFQVSSFSEWTRNNYNWVITDTPKTAAKLERLAQIIRDTDGILIADEHMGLIPLAGKRIYFQPFEYKMLADGKMWEETAFLEAIKNKQFSLIVQFDPVTWPALVSRWTPRATTAIRNNYRLETTIDHNLIYRPKK